MHPARSRARQVMRHFGADPSLDCRTSTPGLSTRTVGSGAFWRRRGGEGAGWRDRPGHGQDNADSSDCSFRTIALPPCASTIRAPGSAP